MWLPRKLRTFARDSRASIAVMSALLGACVIGCAGLAVDVGSLHLERRHLQNMADLAALAASKSPDDARAAAQMVLAANGEDAELSVSSGRYERDPEISAANRFTNGGGSANAVRVTLSKPGKLYFIRVIYGGEPPLIRVSATAATESLAQFSIGSRLASLNAGVVNDLLGGLLGTTVNLNLMDYNGLVAAHIDLLSFMTALASELDITAGTYDSVLDSDIKVGQVLEAAVTALSPSDNAARVAITKLLGSAPLRAIAVPGGKLLDLGQLGDLSLGEKTSGLAAVVNAYDLVRATAQAAGKNQANVDLGLNVPGILGATATIVIGEPPQGTSWVSVGQEGAKVYTAQTRIRLDVQVASLIGGLLRVPILIDVAAGEASLKEIECGANPAQDARVTLQARPSVASLWIGEPKNESDWRSFKKPNVEKAALLNVIGLVKVLGSAHIEATNQTSSDLVFSAADIASQKVRTVSTTNTLSTLLSSLFGKLKLELQVLNPLNPLNYLLSGILNTVSGLLAPVAGIADGLVHGLLDLLGIHIGEADLRVSGVRCGMPALVM